MMSGPRIPSAARRAVGNAVGSLAVAAAVVACAHLTGDQSSAVHHVPVVYVEDHSTSRWPVAAAVHMWATSLTAVVVHYGRCRSELPCVRVADRDEGDNGADGRTTYVGDTSARVELNDHYNDLTPRERLAVACHEIGHALGLPNHNERPDSCLNSIVTVRTRPYPSVLDLRMADQVWRAR